MFLITSSQCVYFTYMGILGSATPLDKLAKSQQSQQSVIEAPASLNWHRPAVILAESIAIQELTQ